MINKQWQVLNKLWMLAKDFTRSKSQVLSNFWTYAGKFNGNVLKVESVLDCPVTKETYKSNYARETHSYEFNFIPHLTV